MRASLFWKLGLTYLLLLLAVLPSVDFYAGRILRENFIQATDERLKALSQLARDQLPPMDDSRTLASWASRVSRSGARVTIIAADGRVLADSDHDIETMENHSNRPEFREAMAAGEGHSVRHSHTLDRDLVYWATRLERDGQPTVVLRLAAPLAQIEDAMGQVHRRLWGMSLLILISGIVISLLFSRRFVGRVARLQEFSAQVARGDFHPLPVLKGKDELSDLARALNETAAHLSATIGSLTEERNRSAAILRSMVEGIAVVDARARVTFYNEAFARIWSIDPFHPDGEAALELVRQPHVLELIQRALSGKESFHGEISVGSTSPRHFVVTAAPVCTVDATTESDSRAASASSLGAVVVLHEVTETRRLEQMRKDFVANVSHELRTPLTAIQGFAETLLSGALEDRRNNRHFVEIIRNHTVRLSRLTDDLLKLSQIEAGKLSMNFQPVELDRLIASAVENARSAAGQKGLSLAIANRSSALPRVLGDEGLLREVLRNLLDNAIQYTTAGTVEVSATADDSAAIITVADTGIGIPQADQSRIFERFYRVDAARSREVGGTGLGLAIAKHIVEAHRGRIWVESAVGQGSKFNFSLPLCA